MVITSSSAELGLPALVCITYVLELLDKILTHKSVRNHTLEILCIFPTRVHHWRVATTIVDDRQMRGRGQEFITRDKRGGEGLGTEVPQRGSGAKPRQGSPLEAGDTC